MAVIAVVGEGMAGTPGIAGRVFTALARAGLNVIAVAQGSSERNISFVVRSDQAGEAARQVHDAFQLAKIGGGRSQEAPHTDVVLLGFGRVGRALVSATMQAEGRRDRPVRVVGLLDRSGYVFDPRGLSQRRLRLLAEGKDQGRLLAKLGGVAASAVGALRHVASHAVSRPVLVDVTAEETGDLLRAALGHGFDLVLANKKPLAGPHRDHAALLEAAAASRRRILYEATVGAGLPILDTHRKLVESGDRVLRIEGCLSGTLGFVLSAVSAGRPFSEAVREAMSRGYTEPDPRDDLSGRDAARKGLILGRLLGYRGAPPRRRTWCRRGSPASRSKGSWSGCRRSTGSWARRVKREAAAGRVLRYLVVATPRSVRAYLAAVPAGSPAGLALRHAQPGFVHLAPVPGGAARHHRPRRGRRGDGRGHPERHPAARVIVNMEFRGMKAAVVSTPARRCGSRTSTSTRRATRKCWFASWPPASATRTTPSRPA